MTHEEAQDKLKEEIPDILWRFLDERDGTPKLVMGLKAKYDLKVISKAGREQRAWECSGLYYLNQGKYYIAIGVFSQLYDQMMLYQEESGEQVHKGMPLIWLRDAHGGLGHSLIAKRYAMLALCEDAIRDEGYIDPEETGTYFRLSWDHGMSDFEIKQCAEEMYRLYQKQPEEGMYPEWILQELDDAWVTDFPNPKESTIYSCNLLYIKRLYERLGDGSGENLERLAQYMLSCVPGFRVYRRRRTPSTDYDVLCAVEGFNVDFRASFDSYFICECKDWKVPADFSSIAKFSDVLDSTKCKFGIMFSKKGISGETQTKDAARQQLKIFQSKGTIIIVIDESDLQRIVNGENLITMLRKKYEQVKFDICKA